MIVVYLVCIVDLCLVSGVLLVVVLQAIVACKAILTPSPYFLQYFFIFCNTFVNIKQIFRKIYKYVNIS